MKDLFGTAILDYQNGKKDAELITWTSISDADPLPVSYLFRDFDTMPQLEQDALLRCRGKVLDVGCGAGSHSLFLKQKGLDVVPIDISSKAIETCKMRGLSSAVCCDLMAYNGSFDTILLLMNGSGVFERIDKVNIYLEHIKSLLNPDGQVLIDSSDIIYMYDPEDLDYLAENDLGYYGELDYYLSYEGVEEDPFQMLYIDFEYLKKLALQSGFHCELVANGRHYDYLARLTSND